MEYYTNVNDETAAASNEGNEAVAAFNKKSWAEHVTQYDYHLFKDAMRGIGNSIYGHSSKV